jgi:hypothetical protein
MILKDAIKKVEASKTYKTFLKENKDYYLAHAFTMLDEKEKKYLWELGYYSPSADKLAVFETEPKIALKTVDDAFKKDGSIAKLEMKEVDVSVAKAMEICDKLMSEKYSAQSITKRIIILQNINGQVYNITLICVSFSLINIKIDAKTGEITSHNLQSIMGMGQWQKGERSKDETKKE